MDQLNTVIQDLINDRPEQARAAIHEYIVEKTQELVEATKWPQKKKKVKATPAPKPTFKVYKDYAAWHDDNLDFDGKGEEEDTDVDGQEVSVLMGGKDGYDVIGIWYRKAKMGTVSHDFAKLNPKLSGEPSLYAEQDPHWPYGD